MTILANGLDTRYITGPELQDYFVNKSTGQPLVFGKIYFYEDDSRTTPKNVFQLTYNSMTGQYSYTALPNPLTLSATGTFDDGNNVNIPVYYYPFDEFGNLQLYYVVAVDSNALLQFTRDAWPFPSSGASGGGGATTSTTLSLNNMLTNPQFAVVNFAQGSTLSIPYTSAGTSFTIAPGWVLNLSASGSGTLTIAQTPVAGSSGYPYNPPFALTVTPGSFITSLTITQQLSNNPDWAAPQSTGIGGYISGSIMLAPNSAITMNYLKNAGSPASQTILTQTNTSGAYTQYNATVELAAASNTSTGITGYDTIQLVLSPTLATTFSNVQVVPLTTDVDITTFDQTPVNRQIDQMFNYYNPLLQYKPISSYLVGWDFPLNPAQFLGASVAAQAVGANKSYYAWDQTIIFQTANSGVTISRDATGALKTLSAPGGGTQLALVQYIPAPQAIEMLSRKKCVNISANASVATDATISLWYTKTSLPSTIGSNLALPLTLDAKGYPATQNGTWTQIPRSSLSNPSVTTSATNAAQFTIGVAPTGAANFNQYPFAGWDMQGNTDINSATFFAIVVGTASLAQNAYILWQSISCQDGDIATVPASKTLSQTLQDCQYYWWSTFPPGVAPSQGSTLAGCICYAAQITSTANYVVYIRYPIPMHAPPTPPTGIITAYNPVSANNKWYNYGATVDSGTPTEFNTGVASVGFRNTQEATDNVNDNIAIHASFDARLGQ